MAGFGSKLMIKRLASGLSLKEISKQTKIKQKHLVDLEEEGILKFSGKEELAEYIKSYADVLGMDHSELLSDLDKVWSDSSTANMYMHENQEQKSGLGLFGEQKLLGYGVAVGVIILLFSVGGYLFWNNFFTTAEQEDTYVSAAEETTEDEAEIESTETDYEFNDDQVEVMDEAENGEDLEEQVESGQDEVLVAGVTEAEQVEDDEAEIEEANADNEEIYAYAEQDDNEAAGTEPEEVIFVAALDDDDLPTTGGLTYLIWSAILTFIAGLALIISALMFRSKHDPVLGPPY